MPPQPGTTGLVTTPAPQVPSGPPVSVPASTAQISVTPPVGDLRLAAGPYLFPIYMSGVSRASTVAVTITFNPAVLRMRTMQEGSFLRQGCVSVVFTPNTDVAAGRIDLTLVRTGDSVGASGSGLLAAIQFDAIASGTTDHQRRCGQSDGGRFSPVCSHSSSR
jgi:hypothetical protein